MFKARPKPMRVFSRWIQRLEEIERTSLYIYTISNLSLASLFLGFCHIPYSIPYIGGQDVGSYVGDDVGPRGCDRMLDDVGWGVGRDNISV